MSETSVSDEDLVRLFPGHGVSHDSAAHFRGRLERRLLINRCGDCGTWHHPPQPFCPKCWSTGIEPAAVRGTGTIHLLVLLHQGPPAPGVDYAAAPYPVATVELDEQPGLRFTATVAGQVQIGDRVALGWAERAGVPLPVFHVAGAR